MRLVISQPMFLPWIGIFEQVRLSDVFLHYDDVQLPQGRSFVSRVQIKDRNGVRWLTAPIDRNRSGDVIQDCWYVENEDWRGKHLRALQECYRSAPHFTDMMRLAEDIYALEDNNVSRFNARSIELIAAYLGLQTAFSFASTLHIEGKSSERLLRLAQRAGAAKYVTGLGALKYLDHELFDGANIAVEYMSYRNNPWPQLHGPFTPYVTMLDPIANCGTGAASFVNSDSIYWKEFVRGTS